MIQEQGQRHIYYDCDLKIEAYNLSGIVQNLICCARLQNRLWFRLTDIFRLCVWTGQKISGTGDFPVEAASMASFSDQSHFINFFKDFISLTPKQYQRIFTKPSQTGEREDEK